MKTTRKPVTTADQEVITRLHVQTNSSFNDSTRNGASNPLQISLAVSKLWDPRLIFGCTDWTLDLKMCVLNATYKLELKHNPWHASSCETRISAYVQKLKRKNVWKGAICGPWSKSIKCTTLRSWMSWSFDLLHGMVENQIGKWRNGRRSQ